ncbi:MAG: HupE/UreJ family protein [Pseudomonadota bacterium]
MSKSIGIRLALSLFGAIVIFGAAPAAADVFRSGELSLSRGQQDNAYRLIARLPPYAITSLEVELPAGCETRATERQPIGEKTLVTIDFACEGPFPANGAIQTPWRLDGARLVNRLDAAPAILQLPGEANGLRVPLSAEIQTRPLAAIAAIFTWQGALHIWFGWDHLAFVLCLCLLTQGLQLLRLVTAFTLGHSISLGLSFFEMVSIPIPPVEAVIALSIAVMAREALLQRDDDSDQNFTRHIIVVSLFGLLHGLGFASALGQLGVAQSERWPALVFFNIGVELGQLVFVAVMIALMSGLKRIDFDQPVRAAALYGSGVIGGFWMMERIAGFA